VRPRWRYAALPALPALLAALPATGCSAAHGAPGHHSAASETAVSSRPAPSGSGPGLAAVPGRAAATVTGRLVLPARTMATGSRMTGAVAVDNNTGHAIDVWGCQRIFAVELGRPGFQQDAASLSCLQRLVIPVGESTYRVTVNATYDACGAAGLPACRPGPNALPPLPPGDYQARVVQQGDVFPAPAPVTVALTR